MKLNQIAARVLEVEPGKLDDQSCVRNVGSWDSLRHIEMIFAIESAFFVRFTMVEIAALQSLGEIRNSLITKGVELAPSASAGRNI